MLSNITYKKWPFLQLVRDIVQMVLHTTLELIILELPDEIEIDVRRVGSKYLLARLREALCVSLLVHEGVVSVLVLLLLLLQQFLLDYHLDFMESEAFWVWALVAWWTDELSL